MRFLWFLSGATWGSFFLAQICLLICRLQLRWSFFPSLTFFFFFNVILFFFFFFTILIHVVETRKTAWAVHIHRQCILSCFNPKVAKCPSDKYASSKTWEWLNHSHKKRKDSLEARVVLIEIFMLCWNLPRHPKHRGSL